MTRRAAVKPEMLTALLMLQSNHLRTTLSLFTLPPPKATHSFFYFLLSTLFNYTVRLMAPGMRVCKKKKITSARLNNYSPFFSTTTSHHHHQYITSNKKKRNKNETSRNPLRETEIKLLPLFLVTIFKPDLTNKSGFTNIAIYGSILYILEVASFLGTRLKIRLDLKINKSVETAGEVSCRVPCILSSFVENRTCSN